MTTMKSLLLLLIITPTTVVSFSSTLPPLSLTSSSSSSTTATAFSKPPLRNVIQQGKQKSNLHLSSSSSNDDDSALSIQSPEEAELYQNMTKQEQILLSSGLITLSDLNRTNPNSKLYSSSSKTQKQEQLKTLQKERNINISIALLSFIAALCNYLYQLLHPVTAVQLLSEMTSSSAPLTSIGRNGKPTVVDFWAPWCENCKAAAPTLRQIEREYNDQVNFVVINGDGSGTDHELFTWELIGRFNVDAIPHLALLDEEGVVQTTLIGPVPRSVLRADIDTLLENAKGVSSSSSSSSSSSLDGESEMEVVQRKELPYKMYDAFRGRPDSDRTIRFDE